MSKNNMTDLENRGLLTKKLADTMVNKQVLKELRAPEVSEAIKDYLIENPIEIIKAMYIVSDKNIILQSNANDRVLEEITFNEHLTDLDVNVEIALLNIYETIKLNEDLHMEITNRIEDSGDLGFAIDLYDHDSHYFDNWVYGDIIKLSNIACGVECITFFTDIFNSIKPETIYSSVYSWIKEELGFEVPVFEIKEDVTLINNVDVRRNKLALRLKDMSNKISRMTDADFNSYEDLVDSVNEDLVRCEELGILDDSLGQLDEEFAMLLFFNSDKDKGNYTVK